MSDCRTVQSSLIKPRALLGQFDVPDILSSLLGARILLYRRCRVCKFMLLPALALPADQHFNSRPKIALLGSTGPGETAPQKRTGLIRGLRSTSGSDYLLLRPRPDVMVDW